VDFPADLGGRRPGFNAKTVGKEYGLGAARGSCHTERRKSGAAFLGERRGGEGAAYRARGALAMGAERVGQSGAG